MKKILSKILVIIACLGTTSCSDQLDIMFKDFFVCIMDANGASSSSVPSYSNEFWVSYFVELHAETRSGDVVVNYEVIPGDGLKEGVDYKLASTEHTVIFPKNVYRMPLRIQYMRHTVDPTKENTLTIRLLSTNDPEVSVGYPGPSKKYSEYVVTKVND